MRPLIALFFISATIAVGQTRILLQDRFTTQGDRLNLATWTTETGPPSFLGRTQLADWITPGSVGKFLIDGQGAHLSLSTYNPTGFSMYGTQANSLALFLPTGSAPILLDVRMRLTSVQPGLVYGVYFYGCIPISCASSHDEIDIEVVTNFLQPGGSPYRVQLNRYAQEPLGAGNGVIVDLPAGFDPLAAHDWGISWSLSTIDFFLDGSLLYSTTTHVPQGAMQANVIAWAPASDWADAFNAALVPVANAAANQTFESLVSSVTVKASVAGTANPGIFRSGYFWLEDVDSNRQFNLPPDRAFAFGGVPVDIPISGDWNGSGTTKVGVYRPSNGLFVLDYDGDGQFTAADKAYSLGVGIEPTDVPVVGDWNGDGKSKVGLFRQGFLWILDNNGNGVFEQGIDKTYAFGGVAGDVPVVGDWNGSGASKIGLFRQGFFWILDTNGNGTIDNVNGSGGDQAFAFGGVAGDAPVVGDWNGDGTSKVGLFRQGFFWVLDANGNHSFDGTGTGLDLAFPFGGVAGDKPVVGKW